MSTINLATYSANFELQDNLSSGLKTAEGNLDGFKGKLDGFSGFLKSTLLPGIAGIGVAIGGAFKLAEKASNLVEAQNVVQQTFKNSSQAVIDWSGTIQESAGISQTNATKFVGSMGAMLKSSGLTEQASKDMAQSLVQLTGDMSSFYNLDHDAMWEKIRSGISGETEPLKQLGINMSVANLEAFALSQGIDKSYQSMTQAEQTTLRYQYLMKTTADAQGDFTRTNTGMANQVRIAQMQVETLATNLGQKLMPSFQGAFQKLNAGLKNFNLDPLVNGLTWVINNAGNIASGIAAVGTALLALNVVSTIQGLVEAFKAWRLATEGMTIAQAALNVVMSANPVGIIIALVAGLIAGIITLWNTNEGFRNAVTTAWNKIKEVLGPIISALVTFFTVDIPTALDKMITFFSELPGKIKKWFDEVIQKVVTWLSDMGQKFATEVPKLIDAYINFWVTLPDRMLKIGRDIIDYLWNGIKDIWAKLELWVGEKVAWLMSKLAFWRSSQEEMSAGDNSSGGDTPTYAQGTPWVPNTGLALLHKGEAVIPAEYNPFNVANQSTLNTSKNIDSSIKINTVNLPNVVDCSGFVRNLKNYRS